MKKPRTIICEKSLKLLEDAFEQKQIPPPKCKTTVLDENINLAGKLWHNLELPHSLCLTAGLFLAFMMHIPSRTSG